MSAWNSVAASLALKSIAVVALAWFVSGLLRGRSAAARHLVWTAAFAALLALPLLSAALPSLPLRLGARWWQPVALFQATAQAPAVPAAGSAAAPGAGPALHAAAGIPDWRLALIFLWAAGTLFSLARLLAGWVAIRRLRAGSPPLPAGEMDALQRSLGIRQRVQLLAGHPGSMPLTAGLLRPAVLLPPESASWDEARRRVVLLHELAHVRRGDVATHLLGWIACALYWWNPLVRAGWRRSLEERERAADDLVLRSGAPATEYAGHLLEIARAMQADALLGASAVAMARRTQLEPRLRAILDPEVRRWSPGRASLAVALLAALTIAAPFAALRAQPPAATFSGDLDATFRAAAAQNNPAMLETAATAAEAQRQYQTAQKLLQAALDLRARASGPRSASYGIGLTAMGDLERSSNHYAEAESLYQQAVAVLGGWPEAAPPLVHLGTLALQRKQPGEASRYFQEARDADPRNSGMALMWLAVVADQRQNPAQAEILFRQAIASEAPESAEAATTGKVLAQFLRRQNRAQEADALDARALAVWQALRTQVVTVRPGYSLHVYHVSDGTLPPKLTFKVEPQYSLEGRLAKLQGTVMMYVEIGPDGLVHSLKVNRGLGLGLDEAAMQAITQWKFSPAFKEGRPVTVAATIEVRFRLL